jgi:hypothetical protein
MQWMRTTSLPAASVRHKRQFGCETATFLAKWQRALVKRQDALAHAAKKRSSRFF